MLLYLKRKNLKLKAIDLNENKYYERLLFFICDKSRDSFNLENYYNFHFNEKAHDMSLDKMLFTYKSEEYLSDLILNVDNCLNNETNKLGILTKTIPRCLEFIKINSLNLLRDNYTIEIDIFIYDFKSQRINLFFRKKIIINPGTNINYLFSDVILNYSSILYKNNESAEDEKWNLRICDFLGFPNISNEKIKMRGIYLEWNIIDDNSPTVNNNNVICFEKILFLER